MILHEDLAVFLRSLSILQYTWLFNVFTFQFWIFFSWKLNRHVWDHFQFCITRLFYVFIFTFEYFYIIYRFSTFFVKTEMPYFRVADSLSILHYSTFLRLYFTFEYFCIVAFLFFSWKLKCNDSEFRTQQSWANSYSSAQQLADCWDISPEKLAQKLVFNPRNHLSHFYMATQHLHIHLAPITLNQIGETNRKFMKIYQKL